MNRYMTSVAECAKIFGLDEGVIKDYIGNARRADSETFEVEVNTVAFFRWMMKRASGGNITLDREESRLIGLRRECEEWERAIATNKALQNPEEGIDEDCLLYLKKIASAMNRDLAEILSGGDEDIKRGIITGHRLALESSATHLSRFMTEPGRIRLRRILDGKT